MSDHNGTPIEGLAPLPELRPDLWPLLLRDLETRLQSAPTMDIRQHAVAQQIRARLLDMVRTRAAEAGPVYEVSSSETIDGAIDALLALWAVTRSAPAKFRPAMDGIVQGQLQVVMALGALSTKVPSGEG